MHSRKEGQAMKNNGLVRLQKYMADNGIASRRKSEEMIAIHIIQKTVTLTGH